MSAEIDALYKNVKAVLWVEDPDTRAWLNALWLGQTPTILVLVAGGHMNVSAVCKQAVDANYSHVFGLTDQDFGTSNRQRWTLLGPNERVYRLDVHEFENLLLDSAALHGCVLNTGKRAIGDIDNRLLAAAQVRAWWVACTRFLADTSRAITDGFPENPGTLTSLADAEAHVRKSTWFSATAAGCPGLADPVRIAVELTAAHTVASGALANGDWRTSFPGKEIFREISGYVHTMAGGPSARMDLVKAVGSWQRTNGPPAQVSDLRGAILART